MRRLMAFALVLFGLAAFAPLAAAEKRVALVIGNNAYPNLPATKQLKNAIADARAMRDTLASLEFEVLYGEDLDRSAMVDRLFDLAARLGKDDVAFFFFAGHGVSFSGANYLLPSNIPAPRAGGRAEEGRLAEQALAETAVIQRLVNAGARVAIVVLDACRDNPLESTDLRTVGEGRGLVRPSEVKGVFSIYSAGFGQRALDRLPGDAHPNSVFTRVFIEKLKTPGLDIRTVATQTRREVVALAQRVGHDQFLAYYDQISGDVYLADLPGAKPGEVQSPPPAAAGPCAAAEAHWRSAERMGSLVAFEDHLARFPECAFAGLARAKIDELKRPVVAAVPPVPAPPPSSVQPAVGTFPSNVGPLSGERERGLKPKDSFKECDTCPEMVVVPAGSFTMGSSARETDRSHDEDPQRVVTFARQFAVGRFAVTFDEWEACVAGGGCHDYRPDDRAWGRGKRPVINVSWNDASAYVAWLSRATGKAYRLLSEAEREYVTRAGTTSRFWWGSAITTREANYNGSYTHNAEVRRKTLPVDSFQPNPWGLFQVHGNVSEWVEDCWNGSYRGAPADGTAWTSGDCSRRVLRGGSWFDNPWLLRSASRRVTTSAGRIDSVGFRVARSLLP